MANEFKMKDGFVGEQSIVLPKIALDMVREDPMASHLYVTDIGYYPHATFHYRERQDPIDQNVLIYCVKGKGTYRIGGHLYDVHENQAFFLPACKPHAYRSDNNAPWTIYWVHFRGSLSEYYMPRQEQPLDIAPSKESRITSRNVIFEEIFRALSDGYSIDTLRYASSLLFGYLSTFHYIKLFRKYRSTTERVDENDIIKATINYMGENIDKTLSLTQLCAYIGYSSSQFSAIFKRKTGHSPLNYFNNMKISKACELLETTDFKVNQICSKVGIDDYYYFSRLFTKTIGISPKKYRQSVIAR